MLDNVSEQIRDCYEHAETCRQKALKLTDPVARQEFLAMEERWLGLARSYEFAERLSRFIDQ